MHHKRHKQKKIRAGCLCCKPHKLNGWGKNRLDAIKTGFSTLRDKHHLTNDLKESQTVEVE